MNKYDYIEIAQRNFEKKTQKEKMYESLQFLHDAELEDEETEQDFSILDQYDHLDMAAFYALGFLTGAMFMGLLILLSFGA